MTQLVTRNETAIVEYAEPEGGWESDGNEDIQPSFPIISIVQPTSRAQGAEKHIGEFFHSDTETYSPTLDVVALVRHETRALFEEGKDRPACMSVDGKAPRPNQPLWKQESVTTRDGIKAVTMNQPTACDRCPFAEWMGDQPPICGVNNILLVERGEDDLAQLRFGGKSIKPYRQFVARKLAPKRLPLFTQRLHLETEIKTEPSKKWAELTITATPLSPQDAAHYNGILRAQRARFEKTMAEQGDVIEWNDEATGAEPLSPFMSEVMDRLDAVNLTTTDLARYMQKTFNENEIQQHMKMAGLDLTELIGLALDFKGEDGLPFED